MKITLTTTFAIAVMVFAFSANPTFATEQSNKDALKGFEDIGKVIAAPFEWIACAGGDDPYKNTTNCHEDLGIMSENESGETDSGREVADSGNEGSTSSASANDQ